MAWKNVVRTWVFWSGLATSVAGAVGWIMNQQGLSTFVLGIGTALILVWVASKVDDLWRMGFIQSETKAWRSSFFEAYKKPATKVYFLGTIYVLVTTFIGAVIGSLLGRSVADFVVVLERVMELWVTR